LIGGGNSVFRGILG